MNFQNALLFVIFAPLLGGLISGLDRIVTARMQSRVGPPILQSFYDVLKLFQKENLVVRRSQNLYIQFFLLLMIFTGVLFFAGGDILLVFFALTMTGVFFVLAGYKTSSAYSIIGANRELLQMVAYEPAIFLIIIGMYLVTGTFQIYKIMAFPSDLFWYTPGLFAALLFILPIKFRKSPFDLSTSHHAHQELVKGITTEFSGRSLAMIEIAHWYEIVIVLGFVYLFFAAHPWIGILVAGLTYFTTIVVDNNCARVRWQWLLSSAWVVPFVLGTINITVLWLLKR